MTSSRDRRLSRQRQQVERRRAARAIQARETQQRQEIAAARRDFKARQRRHHIAFLLWGVASVLAVTHFFEHAGAIQFVSKSLDDLLIGWPTAIALAIVGGVVYGT